MQLDPDIRMLYYRRGQSHHELGMYREADQDYEQSYERRPDYGNLSKSWAWQLSTCPDAEFRDGKKAIRLLTKEGRKGADIETLAAAYAEVGDFEEAVQLQQQLLKRYAGKASAEQLASHQQRLKLYQAKKPYRTRRPASNE